MPSFENEIFLLAELKAGNEAAFQYVYTTYRKWLYLTALGIVQQPEDAEELVQDFFLKLWLKQSSIAFDEITSLRSYFYGWIRNNCINWLDKQKTQRERFSRMQLAEDMAFQQNRLESSELRQQLDAAIAKLPAVRAKVFRLRHILEYSRKETAHALGISEESVKKHLALAVRDLKVHLKYP